MKDRAHPGDVNLGQRVLDELMRLLHQRCQFARTVRWRKLIHLPQALYQIRWLQRQSFADDTHSDKPARYEVKERGESQDNENRTPEQAEEAAALHDSAADN